MEQLLIKIASVWIVIIAIIFVVYTALYIKQNDRKLLDPRMVLVLEVAFSALFCFFFMMFR